MTQSTTSEPSRQVKNILSDAVATGAGDSYPQPASNVTFQITGITTATVIIQGSLDGTVWVQLGSVTANGSVSLIVPWLYVRANVTAWTAGTVNVLMGW